MKNSLWLSKHGSIVEKGLILWLFCVYLDKFLVSIKDDFECLVVANFEKKN